MKFPYEKNNAMRNCLKVNLPADHGAVIFTGADSQPVGSSEASWLPNCCRGRGAPNPVSQSQLQLMGPPDPGTLHPRKTHLSQNLTFPTHDSIAYI